MEVFVKMVKKVLCILSLIHEPLTLRTVRKILWGGSYLNLVLDMSRKNFAAQATLSQHEVYHNRRGPISPPPWTSEEKGVYCLGSRVRRSSGHHATRSPQGTWPLALGLWLLVGLVCVSWDKDHYELGIVLHQESWWSQMVRATRILNQ